MITEIAGQSGADFIAFFGALAITLILASIMLLDFKTRNSGAFGLLLLLPIPWAHYFLKRSSPHGSHLIDFLAEVLEAKNVTDRTGDPITRL